MSATPINKAELIESIKEWIRIDNEIRNLNKEIRDRKTQVGKISQKLMATMKDNKIDEFNVKEGKLVYATKQVKKPITKKYLTDVLLKYYEGDEGHASELNSYIQENREAITKETLRRRIATPAAPATPAEHE
jgi:regulator of replication initiation timing